MQKVIHKVIHTTTAKICEDIAQPPPDELKEPQPIRRCARLVAIAAAGALLVAAIVVMALRIPKLQSEKETLPSDPTAAVKKLLLDATHKGHDVNCPCQIQVMSWCNVTTFHLYQAQKVGASAPNKTFNVTANQGGDYLTRLCKQKNDEREEICRQILGPVLNSGDSRTDLPTASALTNPELLYKEIATRIDTNAYEQSNVYYLLKVINDTGSFNYAQGLVNLVRDMQHQFLMNNYSSSDQDYWNASNDTRAKYNLKFSFGMDVSWDRYLKTCRPAFCDIEYEVSVLNRVLRATGQVGGVTTVITMTLKFLIWPSLRVALRFPTSKSLA